MVFRTAPLMRPLYLLLLIVLGHTAFSQSICEIQGSGDNSPYNGQSVTTEGIITAIFSGAGSVGGFDRYRTGLWDCYTNGHLPTPCINFAVGTVRVYASSLSSDIDRDG